ncbi:diacylglycerol kinase [Caldimonas tepidiphila]|uniref:diacylglycerol kinase n=1 Tax=Caldimonas tepidiphila TaxID=2315841 RepID=UPI000E5BB69B|nr:diacylglycerol kinase [Caldimonas tepidiphila]
MSAVDRSEPAAEPGAVREYKSRGGASRLGRALRYSLAGLRAAWRHEAAFRQEVCVGIPLVIFALWAAPGRWQTLALVASVVFVWVVELLNSALEAVADAVSPHPHPLIGRAKDLGSAAVMTSLLLAIAVWATVFWP